MGSNLTPAGQAIYLSDLPTGSLVTPHDAEALRAAAVAEYGWDGLRRAQFIAAVRNAVLIPDGHCDRHEWAHAAALVANAEGLL
ncbi:hypothetical protein AB0F24_17555 [Streptomyces platensis]|uniref:hypothetical protein n=1 Tax=Streptomyces platensis TaxID=58346 RepID=UPI00340A020B